MPVLTEQEMRLKYGEIIENPDAFFEQIFGSEIYIKEHVYKKVPKLPVEISKMGHVLTYSSINLKYFIGREKEIQKMRIIRNKRIKNNLLIVGKPGTGKTSLVEAYAYKNSIKNIFVVECAKLVSNTEYRGIFEQKVIDLMKFAKNLGLILFFDELHSLIDLGKAQGGMSILDILKPYLLEEDICFIGATTTKEVNAFMTDEAFKRRFTTIVLREPSNEELLSIKQMFENSVSSKEIITNSEAEDVINVLRKKLINQYFPDKFIDFLDYAYAFKITTGINCNCMEILEEYIHDQRLEVADD